MAVEVKIPNGPVYVDMDGFRLGKSFTLEEFRSALGYRPRAEDTFLVTFPKCGTTWAASIAYLIFHKGVPPAHFVDLYLTSYYLEKNGIKALKDPNRQRLIKSHLPYRLIPKHREARYIYVCRNPKDACVSLYYHTRTISEYGFSDGTFDTFFNVFLAGENAHGDYFDHVLSWYERRNDPNVLFVHYEDMKEDPAKYILKLAEFLGEEFHKPLLEDDAVLRSVVNYSDFEGMKKYIRENHDHFFAKHVEREDIPRSLRKALTMDGGASYMNIVTRKGIVGDWKAHLTPTMNSRMEEKIMKKLSHTDILDVWTKHNVM